MKSVTKTCIRALVLALVASPALAAIDAGQVQFVYGDSRALGVNGAERSLKKGDPVYEGETVITGPSASLQLRMADEAIIAVRPNSRLQIEVYRLDAKTEGEGHGVLRLISGTFRSITGLIGRTKKDNYKIITDTANIGIRGTDHEPAYLPPTTAGKAAADPGTYDKVNTGGTYIATPWGRVDVSPNQVGFASSRAGSVPVLLQGVPGFMRSTPLMGRGADASSGDQPARVGGADSDRPESVAAQPWNDASALSYGNDPRVIETELSPDTAVDNLAGPAQTSGAGGSGGSGASGSAGATGIAGVYGDVTAGVARNGAFNGPTTPVQKFLSHATNTLAATDPRSKLIYSNRTVPVVASGSGSFDDGGSTMTVSWGLYGTGTATKGHTLKDSYTGGAGRQPDYVQIMGATETPAAVLSSLSANYSGIVASTPIIAESGAPGGSVTRAYIEIAGGELKQYELDVSDGLSRSWTASCSNCANPVPLATFKDSGIALSGSGPTSKAAGQANGQPVGPTGRGMISSFALHDASAAIAGSFALKQ
jgi:hypothetical protein